MQPLGVGAHPRELREERGAASALAGEVLHPVQATGDRELELLGRVFRAASSLESVAQWSAGS
jgi:hypothetical protein